MLSFLLVRLYTDLLPEDEYGELSIVFAWIVLFNVILAYGMETAFFRFYNTEDKEKVLNTSTLSLLWSSLLFLAGGLLFRDNLAEAVNVKTEYITYTIWILVLDALVIIPFSRLRAQGKPMYYAIIKIANVGVNLGLNVFFLLYLPKLAAAYPGSFINTIYFKGFEIGYIFVSNLVASLLTFVILTPHYFRLKGHFDKVLWYKMMQYSLPVMVAGIAFAINETFDRILLEKLLPLPETMAKAEVGVYSACYKLALFMTLYATAFRLGIEPFFFSYAKNENAKQTYAMITKYFVIFGSVILLCVVVFADILKVVFINKDYWEGMAVVPLIILANFFLGIYHNLSVWYKLSDKTKIGAYISIAGAIVTLALNIILIPAYSYVGSAIATLAAYATMMGISYYFGNKYYPISYDVKRIGLYLSVSILLSALCFYIDILRETFIFGIISILLFIALVYKYEKTTLQGIIRRR